MTLEFSSEEEVTCGYSSRDIARLHHKPCRGEAIISLRSIMPWQSTVWYICRTT